MKENQRAPSAWSRWFRELASTDIYKRSQGRMVRQLTCLAIWVAVALISYRLYEYLRVLGTNLHPVVVYGVPGLVLALGLWLGFRLVNLPSFADFLIAVEAEMNKVSWPSRTELIRASLVVIVLMFGLTFVLFFYDMTLTWLFGRVLRVTIIGT
jgi:preprotein translocase subunit SecE